MADMLNIRGGADGSNSGYVDPAHIGAVFFVTGPDADLDIPEGQYAVYLRLRDGSTLADLKTDDRGKALGRANVVRQSVQAATD